jgi:4-alpha-glucanotransferase
MIETAMQTEANLAMLPLQDLLGLDSQARMNTPGVTEGNWRWRFQWEMFPTDLAPRLLEKVDATGRRHVS